MRELQKQIARSVQLELAAVLQQVLFGFQQAE